MADMLLAIICVAIRIAIAESALVDKLMPSQYDNFEY